MRKPISLLILLILLGCSKDNSETDKPNVVPNGFTEVNVNIELPDNSAFSEEDLTLSSLFTEDSKNTILTFDDESLELAMASNAQGNITMLSYFNPMDGKEVTMNSESTAIAMVMLHPWTMDLSLEAKIEAIEFIKNMPEFPAYKDAVESGIRSGTIDPLNTQPIFNAISTIQNSIFNKLSKKKSEVLQFNIVNNSVAITNALSSASYNIGLYNENNVLVENKFAHGIEKSYLFLSDFGSGIYKETPIEQNTATFNIPTDGTWELRARNGFAFDATSEDRNAVYQNCSKLTFSLIGILSTKLKKALEALNSGNCIYNVGEFIWNGTSGSVSLAERFESYSNNNISGYQLLMDLTSYISNRTDGLLGVIDNCVDDPNDSLSFLNNKVLKKAFSFFNILQNIGEVFNSTALLTDMIIYDSSFDYCVVKDGNAVSECVSSLNYEGTWLITVNNLDGSLHHYERIVFNSNGVSTYSETNIPSQNTGWYSVNITYYINYNPNTDLINISVGTLNFPFVVNSISDTRFYGDGDYYAPAYQEYFKLILDRE